MTRRLVAARVPQNVALGNSLIFSTFQSENELLWMLAWMNSRIAEAQLRLWCSNNNINIFHIRTCRVPQMADYTDADDVVRLAATLDGAPTIDPDTVEELEAHWRNAYQIPRRIWERSVVNRTAPVSLWR